MRSSERGYALLLVVAVVAALGLAVLASARALGDVTTSATRLQESQIEAVAAETLMNRVAFLMMSEEVGAQSLTIGDTAGHSAGRLDLNGSWHAVEGTRGAYIAVQDEAGLFNLNSADEQSLAALLSLVGASRRAPELAAALMDYTDGDDLNREGGAEQRDYARAGLPPPADRPIGSRWQALEVLGWRDLGGSRTQLWPLVSAAATDTGLNINTAPRLVLEAALGDQRRVEMIIRQREVSPLTDIAQVEALTSGTARANGVTFAVAPGRDFRVQAVFGSRGPRHGFERSLELGGSDALRPFKWVEEREIRIAPLRDGEAINSLSLDAPAS